MPGLQPPLSDMRLQLFHRCRQQFPFLEISIDSLSRLVYYLGMLGAETWQIGRTHTLAWSTACFISCTVADLAI